MAKILKKTTIEKLKKAFSKRKEILAVYAFGSRAADFASSQSDLDLAVVVSGRDKISEREIIKFLLKEEIKVPFNLDLSCVDFDSSPLFLYQIIKNGLCIYEKDSLLRGRIEAKILHLYYDNQHMRNIYHYYLQKSFKEGTYGH